MSKRLVLAAAAAVLSLGLGTWAAPAVSGASSHSNAGSESDDLTAAQTWFTDQRLAPNGAVNPQAFAAVAPQAAALPTIPGTWTERTSPAASGGTDFSDDPQFIDPTSGFSNSGAGDRWVAGRVTALAASPDGGTIFAGGADGGVWKSTDQGATWTPLTDSQGTLSIPA